KEATLVEPNRYEVVDLIEAEQSKHRSKENRVRTNNHHRLTDGDLDNGGAEGSGHSSDHHPSYLHLTEK
ncbi:hypothetical protein A2U01_0077720, partial [Trifolium medium]|nr:hypothetical protein [Trifolium medium]